MRSLVTAVLLLVPSIAFAVEVPYSGHLFDDGAPVNGTRYIQLNVYSGEFGGSPLLAQAESLAVTDGVFHTRLISSSSLWDGTDRWVGVSVNGGAEFSPRVKVGWVPYAVRTIHPPLLVFRPEIATIVNGDQWTKVDSLTFTAPVDGNAIINVSGYASWSGSFTPVGMHVNISETTPGSPLSVVFSPQQTGTMAATLMTAVPAGTHTFYLWCRVVLAGQSYSVTSSRFQSLFIPN